jgi:MSHA type pilus biogenesis protein MshL
VKPGIPQPQAPVVKKSPLPPEERLEELMVDKMEPKKEAERLFSFTLRDEEIGQLLLALSRQIPYNIVVDPDISGTVTVDLKDVTLEEALDTFTSLLGLEYKVKGKVIRVFRPKMETRIFTLNYITTIRKGTGKLKAVTGVSGYAAGGGGAGREEAKGGSTIETGPDTADIWKEIEEGLKTMISEKGNLVINKLANIILVTDFSTNLKSIASFLEEVEGSAQRQVMIQAKVVEVTLSDQYKLGLDWSGISRMGSFYGTLSGDMSFAQSLSPGTEVFQIGVSNHDFTALLDAMAQQGQLNILSSPKISTLNNQKAVIKVGREEIFFDPEYDVVTTTDPLTGEIKDTRSVLSSVEPQTVTVGVVLDVTPQISSDGYISMNIHPSVTDLVRIEEFKLKGEVYATAPVIDIRETDTVVRVREGQTIVIAGMMQDKRRETVTRTPLLGNIPGLGALFRNTDQEKQKTELVILLTPTVLVGKRIDDLSREELRRLEEAKRKFHWDW